MNNFIRIVVLMAICSCTAHAAELTIDHELGTATFTSTPVKVAALNWSVTETLLALGVKPAGVADIKGYKQWVAYPAMPDGVTEVGRRREPNLEALKALKPDVIIISKEMAPAYKKLSRIAPTISLSVFSDRKKPLEAAKHMTQQLGIILNKETEAAQLIAETDAILAENAKNLSSAKEPLLFMRFLSKRSVRVHSEGSLINDSISQMGLENAWQDETNMWGFTVAGISKLAAHQNARVMIIGPLSEKEEAQIAKSKLWQSMGFARENRVHVLPAIWTFGGLVAAQRFSSVVADTINQ